MGGPEVTGGLQTRVGHRLQGQGGKAFVDRVGHQPTLTSGLVGEEDRVVGAALHGQAGPRVE